MKSGATETSYYYLQEHYKFPKNVFVSHLPSHILESNHPIKILWAHHAYDQRIFLNFDHNIVNHIVSPSQWNKDMFIKYHNVPEEKITVIPNGVAEMFEFSERKNKTMIFTSIPYKGLEVLSKIIPKVSEKHPDVKFKIFSSMSLYGDDMEDTYQEVYNYLKKLPNVEYSPAVDREKLIEHYQESAFFVHPCIWEETFCVSMIEAMKCGAFPIITDIGALNEVAGKQNSVVVPIDGESTNTGYKVSENFINKFTETCCSLLDYFDRDKSFYQKVSKTISNYVSEKYDWKTIANQWNLLISKFTENTMMNEESSLSYRPLSAREAVENDDYLRQASANVLKWEESDKEMAQGRTNFQIEKFITLNTHNISVTFEHILKERRIMAEGYMHKLIDMKRTVRNFEFKWKDHHDKSKPLLYSADGDEGDQKSSDKYKVPHWYDLEELQLMHYLKTSENEIRDRLHQLELFDRILDKLVERNGGTPPTREQFLEENEEYWDTRLAEQALDDLMSSRTGISGGNLQAMRRASAPSLIDERNNLKEGYLSIDKLLSQEGRDEFIKDLETKVMRGYEKLTGVDLGTGALKAFEEKNQLKLKGDDNEVGGYFNSRTNTSQRYYED